MARIFKVTSGAKKELKRILRDTDIDSGKYLRLAMPPVWQGEGDFGIVIDSRTDRDEVLVYQKLEILLVDLDLVNKLSKSVLNFIDSPEGPRFTLDVY